MRTGTSERSPTKHPSVRSAQLHRETLSVFGTAALPDFLEICSRQRPVSCKLLVGRVDRQLEQCVAHRVRQRYRWPLSRGREPTTLATRERAEIYG